MIDAVIICVVVCVLALIVRGMMRGSIRGCEGNCGSCGHVCSTPRLELTPDQEAQLAELDSKARKAG